MARQLVLSYAYRLGNRASCTFREILEVDSYEVFMFSLFIYLFIFAYGIKINLKTFKSDLFDP